MREELPPETWRPVVGHEGEYEVSDHGQVRSVDRVAIVIQRDRWSGIARPVTVRRKGKTLRPGACSSGHLTVCIKGRSRLVHHLVLEAFVGPRPPYPIEGLHWDDDPANNRPSNLRWGTRSANLYDAVRNGRKATGQRAPNAKLRDADIPAIHALLKTETEAAVARRFGVDKMTIRSVRLGKTWKSVPDADQLLTFGQAVDYLAQRLQVAA